MDNKITTFIFDCFGVIYTPPLSTWYKNNSQKHGFTDLDLPAVLREFDLGNLSEADLFDRFSKYAGIATTKEEIQKEADGHLIIDTRLIEMIRHLKQNGFKIVLLSNANHSFFERKIYADYPEFKSLFAEIVISSEVRMVKPNDDIFLYTLKKTDSKPEECIFIDDSKPNVDAAIALGMQGFLYTDSASFAEYLKEKEIDI